jgi:hypothetical protein
MELRLRLMVYEVAFKLHGALVALWRLAFLVEDNGIDSGKGKARRRWGGWIRRV